MNRHIVAHPGRSSKPWKISSAGIRFLAVCESGTLNGKYHGMPVVDGMILQVYDDGKGNPTVSPGHKVRPSDQLNIGDVIDINRAREFYRRDLSECESAINRRIRVPLRQCEYDALVSIAYNAGPGIAHLVHKVNCGAYTSTPCFIRTHRAKGIEWRRSLEARLFSTGNYDAKHWPKLRARGQKVDIL